MAKATKKLKCSICDKKFVQPELQRHVKIVHEGIKDHQCQFCDMKFGASVQLNRHVRNIDGQSQLSHVCAACCPILSQTLGMWKCHVFDLVNTISVNNSERNCAHVSTFQTLVAQKIPKWRIFLCTRNKIPNYFLMI